MASRLLSPLPDGVSQFRKKPVQRAKLRKTQNHFGKLKRVWIKRAGRKTKEWYRIRRVLKQRFKAVGITICEIKEPGCFGDNGLGFLHYDKRRFLMPAELWIVALGCAHCHDIYELKPRPEMKKAVLKIIAERPVQP